MTTNKKARKETPIASGVLDYFPDALAAVARVSFVGGRQHNLGEPLHWARDKSKDNADCLIRHFLERGTVDDDGMRHSAKVAWRALAMLQLEIEADAGLPQDDGATSKMVRRIVSAVRNNGEELTALVDKTDPHAGKQRIYISGPMRGKPDFNFAAFDKAKKMLLGLKHMDVISPADMDREQGHMDAIGYAKRDTAAIFTCHEMYMLAGWENSIGARAEHALAAWIGLAIHYQTPSEGK